jgi:uncharacterized repeat protein (TIGR01451 family)
MNHRIVKFDSFGNFQATWGSEGSSDGKFRFPAGIAVDGDGSVYVADTENHRIQKFDSAGKLLTKFGTGGIGNGLFDRPIGIDIDELGNIYVADRNNRKVHKFGPLLVDADLEITKIASVEAVRFGETVTYSIEVTNHGPIEAKNVLVTDDLPAGVSVNWTSPDGLCGVADGVVSCDAGEITVGETKTFVISATVGFTVLENEVEVTSETPDPNDSNDRDTSIVSLMPTSVVPVGSVWSLVLIAAAMATVVGVHMKRRASNSA